MKKYLSRLSCYFYVIAFVFIGCATTRVPELKDRPNCKSSVEGFFHSEHGWVGKAPALILKEDKEKIMNGKIISLEDDGVTFDPDKESPFYDPKEKYYPFTDVETLIGEKGELVYGKIPKKYSRAWSIDLHIVNLETPDQKPMKLSLKQNQRFSYCLPAGKYFVKEILFIDKYNNIDCGVDYPKLIFEVKPNCSNYIGDIYLDFDNINEGEMILIPYKIVSRPQGAVAAGFLGGAIGGALYGLAISSKGVIGIHRVIIKENKDFVPELKGPMNISLIKICN